MDVFPVGIVSKGEAVWLGWVSQDDAGEFFLVNNGRLIFSYEGKEGLMQEVLKIFPDAQMEVESFFDFDSAAQRLDKDVVIESDFALDIWNILTDLYHTFGGMDTMFFKSRRDVYLRLFSQSEAAPLVGVQRTQLSAHDLAVVREVILKGADLLDQKARAARMAHNH